MKKSLLVSLSFGLLLTLTACSDDDNSPAKAAEENSSSSAQVVAIDYSAGRAMNKRLGKGINLGNSWDSEGKGAKGDCGWGNCINDNDFKVVKEAGFNSIRLPVRWHIDSDYETHKVNPERLAGVKEDIQLAMDQGLKVIVNFHHYTTLNDKGSKADTDYASFEAEKDHFVALWDQLSKELNSYPDSMLVLEILNEPTISNIKYVNELTLAAYEVIRKNAPKKTIMIESYHAGKFQDLEVLTLPQDGNIIFSGHYYEPFNYTHQGHGQDCVGDKAYGTPITGDMKKYVALAQRLYPDVNGGHVPMNMGEFGVSGRTNYTCKSLAPSDSKRAIWAKKAIEAAEKYDLSWHYWGFTKVGGFEAYDRANSTWYPGFLEAFFAE